MMMRSFSTSRNNMDLPVASKSSVDGGGRSVKMESPLARAIRNASLYTKLSYFFLLLSLFLVLMGVRILMVTGAKTFLKCDNNHTYCNLTMKKVGSRRKVKVKVHRQQLVRTNLVELNTHNLITNYVTKDGEPDTDLVEPTTSTTTTKTPFLSYTLVLRPFTRHMLYQDDDDDDNKNNNNNDKKGRGVVVTADRTEFVDNLEKLGLEANAHGDYVIVMQQYQKGRRRKTTRNTQTRLNHYIMGTRKMVSVRERIGASWKGVVSLIIGIFGFLLTLIAGQFWEEDKRPFVSRRGGKNRTNTKYSSSSNSNSSSSSRTTTDHRNSDYVRTAEIRGQYSTAMKRK